MALEMISWNPVSFPVFSTTPSERGVKHPSEASRIPVILGDASESSEFDQDPYIQKSKPKSVLCCPIISQGNLKGILYLENNIAVNTFTQDHLEILNILASQAAISMENALMVDSLEKKVEARTRELSKAKEEAELANQYKSTFLAQMTHDLRTPLHVVIGILDLFSRKQKIIKDKTLAKPLSIAFQSSERQLNLVNSILDLSKVESGKMEMKIEPFALNDLFIGLEEQVQTLLKEKPIKC